MNNPGVFYFFLHYLMFEKKLDSHMMQLKFYLFTAIPLSRNEVVEKVIESVRNFVGPVAAFKTAIVVPMLPKVGYVKFQQQCVRYGELLAEEACQSCQNAGLEIPSIRAISISGDLFPVM